LGDLAVGSTQADNNGASSGSVWVLYSSLINSSSQNIALSSSGNYNLRYDGSAASERIPSSGVYFKDLDNDSASDLLIASSMSNSFAGSLWMIYANSSASPSPASPGATAITLSQGGPWVCSDLQPANAPMLYSASAQDSDSVLLQYSPADDPVDKYVLEYGTDSGDYTFSSVNIGGKDSRHYRVGSLQSGRTYYFRIRGGNGCATGPWSNELSATTFGGEPAEEEGNKEGIYRLIITVKDVNNNPVIGAKVTLYSLPREATTDENGVASFEGVATGAHRVVVAYDGQQGEENIFLQGEVKEFTLDIQVSPVSKTYLSPLAIAIISILSAGLLIVALVIFKKKAR